MFCITGIGWYFFKLKYLMKIDFFGNIKSNIFYVNKYNIMIQREKISGYIFTVFVSFLLMFLYYEFHAPFSLWIFLMVVIAVAFITAYWVYKRIYDNNIQSIKRSLDELEELRG
jgi:hypothetical protein